MPGLRQHASWAWMLAQSEHGRRRNPQTRTQTKLQGNHSHTHLFKIAPGPKPLKMLVFLNLFTVQTRYFVCIWGLAG
eukprot:6937814-Lingulodinium_polyedra.AAC.1